MHILCDLYRRIFVSEIRGANNGGTLKKVAVVVEPPLLRAKLVLLVHIPTRFRAAMFVLTFGSWHSTGPLNLPRVSPLTAR